MELELVYESADAIPAGMESLYTERDGKFHLTGVKGMKSQGDIERLNTALAKERSDHKKTKEALKAFEGISDPAQVVAELAELANLREQLEASEKGKLTKEQIDTLVAERVKRETAAKDRQIETLTIERDNARSEIVRMDTEIKRTKIHDAVRRECTEANILGSAIEDVLMYAERNFEVADDGAIVAREGINGIAPGTVPKDWLTDMKTARPHWWARSEGGGATGGKSVGGVPNNPWTKEHWNLTAQGNYLKTNGRDKAEAAAKAAGSKVGATAPPSA